MVSWQMSFVGLVGGNVFRLREFKKRERVFAFCFKE